MANRLFYGDNLDVLREHIRDESVDLIYLDPPFNSQATYNILFRTPAGEDSKGSRHRTGRNIRQGDKS
jgi:16S rRNA G966 N2-methylase RsmD